MPGRRYSDGLHQAIEAKESVRVEGETQTLATITIQNYFRLYGKLAGMTGTAETEAQEFWHTYKRDVVVVPTNQPVRRVDYDDVIFKTRREKYNALVEEIAELHTSQIPALVGTISVEASETLSRLLKRRGIPHHVLNAKYHQQEGEVIEHGLVTRAIGRAQKRVEAHNFDIRKHLLEYDDVMNQQRTVIYTQRLRALEEDDLKESVLDMMGEIVSERVASYLPTNERWDEEDLKRLLNEVSQLVLRAVQLPDAGDRHPSAEEIEESLLQTVRGAYEEKEQEISSPIMREVQRQWVLDVHD